MLSPLCKVVCCLRTKMPSYVLTAPLGAGVALSGVTVVFYDPCTDRACLC